MTLEVWIMFGVLLVFAVPLALISIYQPQYRRIEDVALFSRSINIEDFARVTDPGEEWLLRSSSSRREFKIIQRQRIRLCAEYLSRVSHNGQVIQGWSQTEYSLLKSRLSNPCDERVLLLWQLVEAATEMRMYTLIARAKVGLWLLLRADLLPVRFIPQLCDVRNAAGVNLVSAYRELIALAKEISQLYDPHWSEKIASLL